MITNKDRALKVAEFLLQIKAVKLKPSEPFTWASGWKSPIYCDNRKTLSYPQIRTFIRQAYTEIIREEFGSPEVIAGVATGGIAQGALIAQELGLPFIYVRSSAKGHGMQNLIEGDFMEGQNVVVIEDLVSTGGSSLKAVEALREAKLNVKGMVAIFDYGFEISKTNLKEANCTLTTISDYDHLIEEAVKLGYVKEEDLASLREWRDDPANWKK
jgi:orotate phosphoribosyltransferase